MTKEEIMIYIILPLAVALIAAFIIGIFTGVKNKILSRYQLRFKEITSVKDDINIDGFIELYNRRIAESLRICPEQIVNFIDIDPDDNVDHHLYICTHNAKVVGFIKVIISVVHDYLFIAYIAIDRDDEIARSQATSLLIKKIIKLHLTGKKRVTRIFTEIERGNGNGYTTALSKNIARNAANYKRNTYIMDFPYHQPKMPDDSYAVAHDKILSLIYISEHEIDYLSKAEVIEICKNLYYDIYLPSCGGESCLIYRKYLDGLLERYNKTLPEKIELKNARR